jgi:DNA-binding transcriptional LysR family regulator
VAAALATIRAESPQLHTRLRVAERDRIVEAVSTGEIDLGLVDGFASPSDPRGCPRPVPVARARSGWRRRRPWSRSRRRIRWPGAAGWTWPTWRTRTGSTRPR